jgi:hypothetical protein
MKNLIRRMKISLKREKQYRKRHPRPRHDTILFYATIAVACLAVLPKLGLIAVAGFALGMLSLVLSSGHLWRQGRRHEKGYLISRLVCLTVFVLLPYGSFGVFTYQVSGQHLEEVHATDAYIQKNSEAMKHNVEHFVSLYENDKLRVDSGFKEGEIERKDAEAATMFRMGLILRQWLGNVSREDAQRDLMWQMADAINIYGTSLKGPITEMYPPDATHPPIFNLMCIERADGHIAAFPMFIGLPSHDTEREDFVSHGELDGEAVDPPGKIQAPFPLTLDVSTLDFMEPLVEICRDIQRSGSDTIE